MNMKEQNYVPCNAADGIANVSTEMHLMWDQSNLKPNILDQNMCIFVNHTNL